MRRNLSMRLLPFVLVPMLFSVTAAADILYTTLVNPGGQSSTSGYAIGSNYYGGNAIAMPFTLTAGATLNDAVLALGHSSGSGANVPYTLYIESRAANGAPGSIIATLTQVGIVPLISWPFPANWDVTFNCGGGPCNINLAAGSYWLVPFQSNRYTDDVWMYALGTGRTTNYYSSQETCLGATCTGIGTWTAGNRQTAAYQIDGAWNQVPEPGSALLLGAGLLGLTAIIRRKFLA